MKPQIGLKSFWNRTLSKALAFRLSSIIGTQHGVKRRVVQLVVTTVFGFTLVFMSIVQSIQGGFMQRAETSELRTTAETVEEMVNLEKKNLARLLGDWSVWDDPYEFLRSGNSDFIAENLAEIDAQKLGLSGYVLSSWTKNLANPKYASTSKNKQKLKNSFKSTGEWFTKSSTKFTPIPTNFMHTAVTQSTKKLRKKNKRIHTLDSRNRREILSHWR